MRAQLRSALHGGRFTRPVLAVLALGAASGLIACTAVGPTGPVPTPRVPTDNPRLVVALTPAPNVTGDPNAGRQLFTTGACPSCHTLRGVSNANGVTGPNLTNITLRPTIGGGALQNTPENLARWIKNAPSIKQGIAMPPFDNLTDQQTRDLAAFLYSVPYNVAQ